MSAFLSPINVMLKRLVRSGKLYLRRLTKQVGVDVLTKSQTEHYLRPYSLSVSPAVHRWMPEVPNQSKVKPPIFRQTEAVTQPSYVWYYIPKSRQVRQLPYGAILTDGKLLCTDFEKYHLLKNFVTAPRRVRTERDVIIAPWTHYLDGILFGGYYDFVILLAAKLCRIREALPESVYQEAVVSYPLFDTAYEQDYLALLGFTPDRIFDSRRHELRLSQCIMANSGHWFYPDPADIEALKKYIEPAVAVERTEPTRIYISRAGRRQVTNEAALIQLLKKYNFTIIDDKPRSVAEQVAIYKNASFIMGPHGASFTNIIWCEPGTHLFELFSANMVANHFVCLARLMNMTYSAYYHVLTLNNKRHEVEEDIFVSIADLEISLNALLEPV